MREFVKRLSPRTEFWAVMLIAFGWLTLISIRAALHPSAAGADDAGLLRLMVYECAEIAVLGTFLAMRGWTFEKIGLTPSLADTGLGAALFMVQYFVFYLMWTVVAAVAPDIARAAAVKEIIAPGISPALAILTSFINPIFEEVFVCGYVIAALKRGDDARLGINVSVAIRL